MTEGVAVGRPLPAPFKTRRRAPAPAMAPSQLPGLSAMLTHAFPPHRVAFHHFVREQTMRRRGLALLGTSAALGWFGGWETSMLALLSVGCTSELSGGAKDPTLELLLCFVWLAVVGMLAGTLAEEFDSSGGGGSAAHLKLLLAVVLVQLTLFHQLLLPWYPYLPLIPSVLGPLLVLFAHPSWAPHSLLLRTVLAIGVSFLLPLIHLVVSYAARTIWCQEWLLAQHAPELYKEVLAERQAVASAAAGVRKGEEGEYLAYAAAGSTVVAVVGLPRSGTTYLFSLLERLHGDGESSINPVVALSCYHIMFFERSLEHCSKGPAEVAKFEALIDRYFKDIGLNDRLIDKVAASARATEEYLHWLMPRHGKRRLDLNPGLCGKVVKDGAASPRGSGFVELSHRMLMVDEARRAATIESDGKGTPNGRRVKGQKLTILHKNPEEEDAVGLYSNLRNAAEIGQGHANVKLVHIERSIPPLFNSLLGFFMTFFDIGSTKPGAGGYAALNPYYFLFSAALPKPSYLP